MFEIEPILWLQAHGNAALTWLMHAVSALGQAEAYAALLLVLMFGVRLRPALGLLFVLGLAGCLVGAAKTTFALPRPPDVDVRVRIRHVDEGHALAEHGGARSFWALPEPRAIALKRQLAPGDYGFVSTHVATAAASVFGVIALFAVRAWRWRLALAAWPLLMALSRLYLGRHFLADVCGGYFVGMIAGLAGAWLYTRAATGRRLRLGLLGGALLLAAAALAGPYVAVASAGALLGALLALPVLDRLAPATEGGGLARRLARILVAGATVAVGGFILHGLLRVAHAQTPAMLLLAWALGLPAVLALALLMLRRLGLYRPA